MSLLHTARRPAQALLLVAAVLAALFTTLPPPASAHGATSDPPQRTYVCRYTDPTSPMCAEAYRTSPQAVYDWMEVRIADAGGRHRELIPDGKLCSANDPKYALFDTPTRAWTAAPMSAGKQTFTYFANAPHATLYFRYYLSKQGYDVTKPLRWDDLELIYDSAPLPALAEYDFEIDVPQRTGRHIAYVVWQRSDLPEAFYGCSDVDFGGEGQPVPSPSPTTAPAEQPLTVSSTTTSEWAAGWCADVTVTNPGPRGVSPWKVELPLAGTVTGGWGATLEQTGGTLRATGASWNATLVAGASATFGYCASRTAAPPSPSPTSSSPSPSPTTVPPSPSPTTAPPSPSPTPTGTPGAPLTVASVTTGDWGTGWCADVTVTNPGTTRVSPWAVSLPLKGMVTSSWNATLTQSGDIAHAAPAAWNATLEPGASRGFGYCAQRPPATAPGSGSQDISVSSTVTSDWGTGWCGSVQVTSTASGPVTWTAQVPVPGALSSIWNGRGAVTGGVLRATGESWNAVLAAGTSTSFGYCATR